MRLAGALAGVRRCRFSRFDQLFLNSLSYCMLMRASAWRAAGGYDETMRNGMDDWEFNIRLAAAGYRGLEIAKPLFIYTVRADGMLLTLSARVQGTGWRRIREKHQALYRMPALLSAWRDGGGGIGFRDQWHCPAGDDEIAAGSLVQRAVFQAADDRPILANGPRSNPGRAGPRKSAGGAMTGPLLRPE